MSDRVRERRITYLVAVAVGNGTPTVYAAMGRSATEAIDAVRGRAVAGETAGATVSVVGSLSTSTAKAIKLKPDEVRAV